MNSLSKSYPFLQIARETNSDYGLVLHYATLMSRRLNWLAPWASTYWENQATQKLKPETKSMIQEVVNETA